MTRHRNYLLAAMAFVASCAVPADTSKVLKEDPTVTEARTVMLGMSEADVRMCAGFPTFGVQVNPDEKIWTFQRTYARGGLTVGVTSLAMPATPGLTGSTATAAPGFCNTQVRIVKGKVVQVEFAGDNNTTQSINGLCVSTIDQCVIYARRERKGLQPSAR